MISGSFMIFKNGCVYKHMCAGTYDVLVSRMQYADEKRIKFNGFFVSKLDGTPQGRLESFIILAEEFPYWERIHARYKCNAAMLEQHNVQAKFYDAREDIRIALLQMLIDCP